MIINLLQELFTDSRYSNVPTKIDSSSFFNTYEPDFSWKAKHTFPANEQNTGTETKALGPAQLCNPLVIMAKHFQSKAFADHVPGSLPDSAEKQQEDKTSKRLHVPTPLWLCL